MTLVSVQAFGLAAAGGGPRIMRALLAEAPVPVASIVTGADPPPAPPGVRELHVPLRPRIGPLEGTRLHPLGDTLELAASRRAAARLEDVLRDLSPAAVHAVSHGPEFWPALRAARRLDAGYVLTVHDDLRYLLRRAPLRRLALRRLGRAWREADERLVISEAMGREYGRRYGERPYAVVTDGVPESELRDFRGGSGLRVYFAGLFHRGYRRNLDALAAALGELAHGRDDVGLRMRCGTLPDPPAASFPLEVLPFGPESAVQADLAGADLLYLPLMFGDEYRDMVDFSLSTKLVTYLGSGIPILYHGPPRGAAYEILAAHGAAIMATTEDPHALARAVEEGSAQRRLVTARAQELARSRFTLGEQRRRFWAAVARASR